MTFAIGPVRPGFPTANAVTAHEEMKRLRNMLLAVGLEELQTPESYDASEGSDESDVPTTEGGRSKYMYFAFTDDMQAEAPIYIGVRLAFDYYFNTHSTGKRLRRVMEAMVSRTLVDGVPTDIGALFSFSAGGQSTSSADRAVMGPLTSHGDFVKFSNGTLFIAFGANAQQQSSVTSQYWGPAKCSLFMILARTGKNVSVFMDRRRGTSNPNFPQNDTETVLPAALVSPFSNTYVDKDNSIFTRAGDIFFDGGTPVVAPIFGRDEYDNAVPLSGVYTIPVGARIDLTTGHVLRLDFTGEEKDYLYFHSPSVVPSSADQGWLIEWR